MNLLKNKQLLFSLLMKFLFSFFLVIYIGIFKNVYSNESDKSIGIEESSNYKDKNYKSLRKFNMNILTRVLMGLGYSNEEAKAAVIVFSQFFPIERLSKHSDIIIPKIVRNNKAFAININNKESIILEKINKKFVAYIGSTITANNLISENLENLGVNKGIIKLKLKEFHNNIDLVFEDSLFKKGSTISSILSEEKVEKKIKYRVVKELRKHINPSKIKIGTKLRIIKANKKLIGLYITINKYKCILITIEDNKLFSKKINIDIVENYLKDKFKVATDFDIASVTRVNLFNNPDFVVKKNIIKKGQSFYELLYSLNISSNDINKLLKKANSYYDPKKINVGQPIDIIFYKDRFLGISYKINQLNELQIIKDRKDYLVYLYEKPYKKKILYNKIIIKKNLYLDSKSSKLPTAIFVDLVRLLSFTIDFQRDIQKETVFKILFENLYDYNNTTIRTGKILYSQVLFNKNNKMEMFYFKIDNFEDYYDEKGKSIRKTLMRTPIDGARLSSRFGNRKHPILGYNKMHKGLDFAARIGTPIFAAGDGIIERANYFGGYGRYIRIRHNSEYKTAYAHLSKFAKNIKKGKKVKQGSTIGYVGTTGRSTGPHLHYEVLFNKKQIDPYKLKMPEKKSLNDKDMSIFESSKNILLQKLKELENK